MTGHILLLNAEWDRLFHNVCKCNVRDYDSCPYCCAVTEEDWRRFCAYWHIGWLPNGPEIINSFEASLRIIHSMVRDKPWHRPSRMTPQWFSYKCYVIERAAQINGLGLMGHTFRWPMFEIVRNLCEHSAWLYWMSYLLPNVENLFWPMVRPFNKTLNLGMLGNMKPRSSGRAGSYPCNGSGGW